MIFNREWWGLGGEKCCGGFGGRELNKDSETDALKMYKVIFCIHEWMSYVFDMLFLFCFVVMYLLLGWYEMDVCVELLADDVWSDEDNKTGSLSVEANIFDWLNLEEWPIS